jgi:hypothetical protein
VLTPPAILELARAALGGDIQFDPCASTDPKNWFATELNWCLPPRAGELQALENPTKAEKAELKELVNRGSLIRLWPKVRTFINPHFDTLKPWMYALRTAEAPTVLLCPVRPHRRWWCDHAGGLLISFLRPFPFVGSKSPFPAPLCLIYKNCEPPMGLHELETRRVRW